MLEVITPYAPLISAISALISTIAVIISTGFIIWMSCFRKTRRDRIDELKEEIQVKLSQGWTDKIVKTDNMEQFICSLDPKFQKPHYKKLHQCAYNELAYEGKNEVVNFYKKKAENQRYQNQRMRENYQQRIAR